MSIGCTYSMRMCMPPAVSLKECLHLLESKVSRLPFVLSCPCKFSLLVKFSRFLAKLQERFLPDALLHEESTVFKYLQRDRSKIHIPQRPQFYTYGPHASISPWMGWPCRIGCSWDRHYELIWSIDHLLDDSICPWHLEGIEYRYIKRLEFAYIQCGCVVTVRIYLYIV